MFSSRFNSNPFLMKMAKLLLKKKGEGVKCNMFVINYNCILGIKNKSLMSYGLVQLLVIIFNIWLVYGVKHHFQQFQQYFSYIVAVQYSEFQANIFNHNIRRYQLNGRQLNPLLKIMNKRSINI